MAYIKKDKEEIILGINRKKDTWREKTERREIIATGITYILNRVIIIIIIFTFIKNYLILKLRNFPTSTSQN